MKALAAFTLTLFAASAAHAVSIQSEAAYIFNTLIFLIGGFLVMFMAAGFSMLESGLVRSSSVVTVLTKNIGLYAIAGLMFYLVGYNLLYRDVDLSGGFYGVPGPWSFSSNGLQTGYSPAADWFFQMVFVGTTASIVSGTVAERVRLWPFFLFVALLAGVIYPVVGSWKWGHGWLDERGFMDFAGSTMVHTTGGWAALMGAIIIGPRYGRFPKAPHRPTIMMGSNLPLATLGTFILWLGWLGFNGASQMAFGSVEDAHAVATVFVNTNMAAAAGTVTAMALTQLMYKKIDLTMVLNGALGGLVSITADPLAPSMPMVLAVGVIGAVIVVTTVPLLNYLKIDDVVGAVPVHLCCGVWGTLAVSFTNPMASFQTQLLGVLAVGLFVSLCAALIWGALRLSGTLVLTEEEQRMGTDIATMGMEAYPDFVQRTGR